MSDDFLADIDAAVDNGGSLPVTNDVTPDTPKEGEPKASVVEEVAERIAPDHEKRKPVERKASTESSAQEEQEEEKTETVQEKVEETPTQESKPQQQKLLLDTFLGDDGKGNLVLSDGTIIATSGKSRSFYEGLKKEGRAAREAAERLASTNAELGKRFKELYGEYQRLQTSDIHKSITDRTGLNAAEVEESIQIMKAFKANPLEGVKQILTRAQLSGTDLSELGIKGGLSLGTIKEVMESAVEDKLKSFTQPVTDTPKQREARVKDAVSEVQAFAQRHPDAAKDQNVIRALAQAKQRFPDKSLDTLFFALQRSMRKKSDEAAEKSWKEREVKPAKQQQPSKRIVKTNNPNFAAMSFDDIAQSILEDI